MTTTHKLGSIITLNFDSLIDIIEVLQAKNDSLNDRMQDLVNKMSSVSDFREDIDNIKYKTDSVYSKMSNVEQTIDSYSKKFIDVDKRFQELQSKIEKTEGTNTEKNKSIKEIEDKVSSHEANLNNLNRVVEENIKASDKEKERTIRFYEDIQSVDAKLTLNQDEINGLRANTVESVKRLELIYEAHDATAKDLELKLNKKLIESEKRMNLIIDTMNQLHNLDGHSHHHSQSSHTPRGEGQKDTIQNEDNANQSNDVNSNNQTIEQGKLSVSKSKEETIKEDQDTIKPLPNRLSIITSEELKSDEMLRIDEVIREIGKIQATIESVRLDGSKLKENTEQEFNRLKQRIASLNNPIDNLPDFNMNNDNQYVNQLPQMDNVIKEEIYTQTIPIVILDEIKLKSQGEDNSSGKEKNFLDNLKLLASAVESKASKDDLVSTHNQMLKELDSLSHKLNESLHQYDIKLKLIANISKGNGPGIDPEALTQTLNSQINHVLKSSAKELIQNQIPEIDLTQNENFSQAIQTMQNHTEELNKTYESIVDIRNNLLSKQVEDHVSALLGRMTEVETSCRKVKFEVDELIKSLEDDLNIQPKEGDDNGKTSMANQVSLRESVNILTSKLITINDKVEKLEKKQSEIHKNILIIVKQDLKTESNRILEEFKSDLKVSIAKIEEQLREKVDKFNLAEFSQRIDSKLNSEIKRKLDRGDLNKNNSMINRKIDSLEDKISKQLVDTLIDLQLEEAPLIVKKTMKPYDKCASCNQTLPQRNNYYMSTSTDANNSNNYSKYKNTKYSLKDKLPEINTNF